MARLIPDIHDLRLLGAGQYRERDVLQLLADGLPADWTVLHSVSWSGMHPTTGTQCFGEVDAVVLAPWGHLVLIEVKAGALVQTAQGWVKSYGGEHKSLDVQARVQHAAMCNALQHAYLRQVRVGQLLVLPDQRVQVGTVAHPRERIVDSQDFPQLATRVLSAMPPAPAGAVIEVQRVLDFLLNRFQLVPDVALQSEQAVQAQRRLAHGLATWVPRISSPAQAFVIEATAGSGKTQLALALIAGATRAGQRVAYVCFNRTLADHMRTLVSPRAEVTTVHEWALHRVRQMGWEPDFAQPGVFDAIARRWMEAASAQEGDLDLLIMDESQDFEPGWVEALVPRLQPSGRLYVLGDSDQALYERRPFELPEAVYLRCRENFRSPRRIVATLNGLGLGSSPVEAAGVLEGDYPDFVCYGPRAGDEIRQVEQVLHGLWRAGHQPGQVVLLSWHKASDSAVLQRSVLAGQPVRRWLGHFDAAANPVFSPGELRAETVARFKGQSAPVIVLTGVDFDALNEPRRRRLFVAMTRAQLKFVCLLTAAAEQALVAALDKPV